MVKLVMGTPRGNLSLSTLARTSQAGLAFALNLWLALVLPAYDLGVYVLCISTATILQYVFSYWFSVAVLRQADVGQDTVEIYVLAMTALSGGVTLTSVAVLSAFGLPVPPYAYLVVLLVVLESWFVCQANVFAASGKWGRFSLLYGGRGILNFGLPALAAWMTKDSGYVVLAYATGVLLPILVARDWRFVRYNVVVGFDIVFSAFRVYFPLSINLILRQIFDRGDRIVVGLVFGVDVAGYYGISADIMRRPIQTLASATQAALLPSISRAYREQAMEKFRQLWALNGRIVIWISTLAACGSILGLYFLFFRIQPGRMPDFALWIAIVVSVSAILEAIDTYHVSVGLVTVGKAHLAPLAYAVAALAFLACCYFSYASQEVILVAIGVVVANIMAVSVVYVVASKYLVVPVNMHSALFGVLILAFSVFLVLVVLPELDLFIGAAISGAAMVSATLFGMYDIRRAKISS